MRVPPRGFIEKLAGIFDKPYLDSIRFVYLAFIDEYIDTHFAEIREHRSDIETRQDEDNCTIARLKDDNRKYIDSFKSVGERVFLINSDYEQMIQSILDL